MYEIPAGTGSVTPPTSMDLTTSAHSRSVLRGYDVSINRSASPCLAIAENRDRGEWFGKSEIRSVMSAPDRAIQ